MHPRNKYKEQPDFKELALKFPDFRQYVTQDISGRFKVNFKDPLALRSLTKCLLKMDFGLEIDIPENHLIPTVPQRLNYLLWVEDLLNILPKMPSDKPFHVIDLGTGPSCIFPLLGSKTQKWKFLASESNDEGFYWASKNVEKNNLQDLINVVKVERDSSLLQLLENDETQYDATMCNPPFFTDANDANWEAKSRTKKRPPPNSCNPAHKEEIIFDGGEVAFVKKMISDSQILKEKVRIYTTMLGKKCSLKEIKHHLNELKIPHFTTTEFHQGKTMRWGIAWSYVNNISFNKVFRPEVAVKKPTPVSFFIPSNLKSIDYTLEALTKKLLQHFVEINLQFQLLKGSDTENIWNIKAKENTWSHQRRKRRQEKRLQQMSVSAEEASSSTSKMDNGIEVNQSKKRENVDNDLTLAGPATKKARVELNSVEQDEFILDCTLTLKLVGKNFVLELLALNNSVKKEVVHQVLQFFKNKFP